MSHKYKIGISFLDLSKSIIILLLPSCISSVNTTIAINATITPVDNYSVTDEKNNILGTPTIEIIATKTQIFITNTQKNFELSTIGPWLVYEGTDYGSLFITDIESNPALPIEIELSQADFPVSGSIGKGLIALIVMDNSKNDEQSDYKLLILKPPKLELVEEIYLLSYKDIENNEELYWNTRESVREPPQWSPNGRYLAFVGAMEGPSGDLYVYDSISTNIIQTTTGPNQVGKFWWSPDSKWIVHEEIIDFIGWQVEAVWAAKYDGSEVRRLYSPKRNDEQVIVGWTTPHSYISYDRTIDLGFCHIRYTDINLPESIILFKGCSENLVIDSQSETIAFIPVLLDAYVSSDEEFIESLVKENSIFMISRYNLQMKRIITDIISSYIRWDSVYKLFITQKPCDNNQEGVQAFTTNGKIVCETRPELYPSPNGKYLLGLDPIIILYNQLGEEITRIETVDGYKEINWLPDSRGFLFQIHDELFYFSVPEMNKLIMVNGPDLYRKNFQWVYLLQ